MNLIYLDNAATTRVDDRVVAAMLPYFTETIGNASSVHSFGQSAEHGLDQARQSAADFLGCSSTDILFTSGATESNNLAIQGVVKMISNDKELVTTTIEHPSVLSVFEDLEKQGFIVHYVPVDSQGIIDLNILDKVVSDKTALVSTMFVNNEVGVVQPLAEIKTIVDKAKDSGSSLYWHVDAVQAGLYFDCKVENIGCDLLTLSSHKIHGPKGAGLLYHSAEVKLKSLFVGGHQEFELRPGTENIPAIVGFGKALELAKLEMTQNVEKVQKIQKELISGLKSIDGINVLVEEDSISPHIVNVSIKDVSGERLIMALDMDGVAISTGSACAAGSLEPSHVLVAMGVGDDLLKNSIRISLSKYSTIKEIESFIEILKNIVKRFRSM